MSLRAPIKLCFLVAAHDRAAMLEQTFKSIYDSRHRYLIHVDRKSDDKELQQLVARLSQRANVRELARSAVAWGGFSQVAMELRAVRAALEWGVWDYFIFLSGTDLLVRPLHELEAMLADSGGRSFIDRRRIRDLPSPLKERIQRRSRWLNVERDGRVVRLFIPLQLFGLQPTYYGSQWHFLQRSYCSDVMERIRSRGIPKPLRHCVIPDEVFWQNILNHDSTIAERIIPQNHRYAVFHGKPSPKWITLEDVAAIEASGAYIARKFDPGESGGAIDYFMKGAARRALMTSEQ